MADTIHVKGLSDLQKVLETLPTKLHANVLRDSMKAGAKLIQNDAKQRAPIGERGALKRSLRIRSRRRQGVAYVYVTVGGKYRGETVRYAHLIEMTGAQPHWIAPRRGVALYFGGRMHFGPVYHPGFQPKPFLRPALDSQAYRAVTATAQYMRQRLATKHGLDTRHIMVEGDE